MRTVLRGRELTVSADEVKEVAARLSPQPVRKHAIVVNGHDFPPKQLLEAVLEAKGTRMDRLAYTSKVAYYLFTRLDIAHVRLGEKTEGIQALRRSTLIVALGGDALKDSERYYE